MVGGWLGPYLGPFRPSNGFNRAKEANLQRPLTRPEALDFLLRIFQMPFRQVYVPLRCVEVRMPHQFRHTEYIDAGFDRPSSIGMPKIVEPEWRLDSAFPQRSLMGWFEFRHRPRPVVPIPNPSRKKILALCFRKAPIENRQCS